MRRTTLKVSALLLVMAIILGGCAGTAKAPASTTTAATTAAATTAKPAAATTAAPAKAPIELRCGTIYADNTPTGMSVLKFAEIVKAKTNGEIIINHFPSSQLGTENEMLESVGMGAIDFSAPGSAVCGTFTKSFLIFSIPYLIKDWDHLTKVMSGEIGQKMSGELTKATGVRVLANNWFREPRYLYGSKEVKQLSDLKGFRIRVPENPAWVKGWQKLGASPTPMALGEVYTAVETGALDGAETTISYYWSNGFYNVAKFFVNSSHMYEANLLVANEKRMQSFTPEQQKIITDAAIEAGKYHQELVTKSIDDIKAKIKAAGVPIAEIDRAAWIKQMEGIENDTWQIWGDKELYGKIKALA